MESSTKRYSLIDHTADTGFEVRGEDFPTLLKYAAEALFDIITDISSVQPAIHVNIRLQKDREENMMRSWLENLLSFLNTDDMLFSEFKVSPSPGNRYKGEAWGEVLDDNRHTLHTEIKGITYHQYEVSRSDTGWYARIILDV